MKLGVLMKPCSIPTGRELETVAGMGVEGVQCYATAELLAAPEILLERCRRSGLACSALVAELGGNGFQIASENPEKIKRLIEIFAAAERLNAKVVTGHIGVIPGDASHPRRAVMLDAMRRISDAALARGVVFGIETGPEPPAVLQSFLDQIGGGVGVNFDPANLQMVQNAAAVPAFEMLKDRVVYTHAKDGVHLQDCAAEQVYDAFARGGFAQLEAETGALFKETALGEGQVDFKSYLAALAQNHYQGYLTIERETGKDPDADIAKAVNFLRNELQNLSERVSK